MPATKDQIADAFERQVGHFGYSRATVEDVASELGISKKTIYEHFSSKRDLYSYVVERIAANWRSELRAATQDASTWAGKLERLLAVVFAGARQHIAETSKADWQQEYEVVGEGLLKAVGAVVREVIAGGVAAGEFVLSDPVLAERLLSALALEYTMVLRDDLEIASDAEVIEGMKRFLGAC